MPQHDRNGFRGSILSPAPLMLGEGPTYDPATDTAWWFDIVGRKLIEHRIGHGEEIAHEMPLMASMLARIDERRQFVATEKGLYVRNMANGAMDLHTPIEADNDVTRSNDGRVHPSGALWIGTMGKSAENGAGAIYWFRHGEVRLIVPEISIPNAISFSSDGRIGYFADTARDTVFRAELDPETGLPLGQPAVFLEPGHDAGSPDGAVVDAEGCLWCARWGGSAVSCYDAEGRKQRSVSLPASQITCPAFVGRDADRLIVTSARENLDEEALSAEPAAGNTFLLDIGVNGRHDPPVLL